MQPDLWTDKNLETVSPQPLRFSGLKALLLGVTLGSLLTLAATRLLPNKAETAAAPPAQAQTQNLPRLAVTTALVELTPVNRTLKATGTVTPAEQIPVLSQATGLQIQQTLVEEGEWVRQGQLLARLDDTLLQAQRAQAEANIAQAQARLAELEAGNRREAITRAQEAVNRLQAEILQAESDWQLAQKRVERNQTLQAEGAIAQDRLDEVLNEERSKKAFLAQVQARLREAQAQLEELEAGPRAEVKAQALAQLAEAQSRLQLVQAQRQNTQILAPVSGKVVKRHAKVGDVTNPQTPLFEIIEDGRLELHLQVPENQLRSIRLGQAVTISSDSDRSLNLRGQVQEIYPTVDVNSRQGIVKVSLPEPATTLKSGMFLQGAIITETRKSLTLPLAAVLPQSNGDALVYVLRADNTVQAQLVKTGDILPSQQVEIVSGLEVGERVVLKGAAYLKDGDTVLAK
jgi:multidrug efflux pump subunit AcrA (membrane-fusion protein)